MKSGMSHSLLLDGIIDSKINKQRGLGKGISRVNYFQKITMRVCLS